MPPPRLPLKVDMNTSSLLAAFGVALLLPTTVFALTDSERAAYTLLLMGPKENRVKSCASAALRLNLGLIAVKIGRASDTAVEDTLLENANKENPRLDRERQSTLWKTTHNAPSVAELNFFSCTRQNNVRVEPEAMITTCFSLAGVPALADAMKMIGQNKEDTTDKVLQAYSKQLPESFIRAVVDNVYTHDVDADNLEVHRRVLGECIRDTPSLVSEEEMRAEYDKFIAASGDKEYRISHILLNDQAAADQLLARIRKGEPFTVLAKAYSLHTDSKQKGGDLDWVIPSELDSAMAAAVTATPAGEVAALPIQSRVGWHIVKVDAVRALKAASFADLREAIRGALEQRKLKARR